MDTKSKEPELNQESETSNEVILNEKEVIETVTPKTKRVSKPKTEIKEILNGTEKSENEKPKKTRKKTEVVEKKVTKTKSEVSPKKTTSKTTKVAKPEAKATEGSNSETEKPKRTVKKTEIIEEKVHETINEVISENVEIVKDKAKERKIVSKVEEPVKKEAIKELKSINISAIDIPEIDSLELNDDEKEPEVDYDAFDKEQLVVLLEEAIQTEDINNIKAKVVSIKVAFLKKVKEEKQVLLEKFIAAGGKKEEFTPEEDDFELRYRAAFDVYKERKALFNDEQEKIKYDNLQKKQAIIDELKELINSDETLKHTYDEFKSLQERWKEVGPVPRTDINTLWQNYHFLVERFFDKVKINKELRDLDMRKNMESKIELCEKAEELLLEPSLNVSFKKLQEYHDEWKHIGPVPQDKKDELWERFKNISDQINDRRREYYENLKQAEEGNLLAKTALCEKAEQIANKENKSLNEWQNSTEEINEVVKIWKTIGPTARKQNDEIWARFRTYLDTFFANKKEYYDKLKEEQVNNLNQKVDLCLQAESIMLSTDWKKSTNELLDLQKQWKEIGPVPRKSSDKVWYRFRAACDEFFKNKNDFFKNINENESNNLKQKEELIQKVKDFEFGPDRNENLQALKDFQRLFTEIGFIPFNHKDRIQNEFRQAINICYEKLKISSGEVSAMNFNQRIEKMNPADASRFIGKERTFLQNKINQLKDDINLWENNIGFLSRSKNADLLKLEFEKKINNAKQDLIVMEAKLKAMHT